MLFLCHTSIEDREGQRPDGNRDVCVCNVDG